MAKVEAHDAHAGADHLLQYGQLLRRRADRGNNLGQGGRPPLLLRGGGRRGFISVDAVQGLGDGGRHGPERAEDGGGGNQRGPGSAPEERRRRRRDPRSAGREGEGAANHAVLAGESCFMSGMQRKEKKIVSFLF